MDKNNPEFFIRFKSLGKMKSFQNDMEKSKMNLIVKLNFYKRLNFIYNLAVVIIGLTLMYFILIGDNRDDLRAQVQMYKSNCECKAIMFKEINE